MDPGENRDTVGSTETTPRKVFRKFQETVDKTPPWVRQSFEPAIAGVTVYAKGVYDVEHAAPLKTLHRCVSTVECVNEARAKEVMDSLKGVKGINDQRDVFFKAIQSNTVAEECLQNCSSACLKNVANSMLGWSIGFSWIGIVVEGMVLYMFWKELRSAQEFARSEFQGPKESIEAKIKDLVEKVNAFARKIEPQRVQKLDSSQQFTFFRKVIRERDAVNRLIRNIVAEIDAMEKLVTTRRNTLQSYCSSSLSAALAQGIQATSLSVTTGIFAAAANPVLAGAAGVTIVAHVVTLVTRLAFWRQARTSVDNLDEKIKELNILRIELQVQQDKLDECFEEFQNLLDGMEEE